jgi:hypothetical protein
VHTLNRWRLLHGFVVAWLGASVALAAEQKACAPEDCVRTPYGVLELKATPEGTSTLALDGDALKTFEHAARLRAAHPDRDQATLILIESTDAKSCAMYRVLEVKAKDELHLSAEFGNCRPLSDEAGAQGIVFEKGEWRIALPPANSQGTRNEWYAYREGRVYKEQVVAGRNADPEAAALKNLEAEVPDKDRRDALIRAHGSASNAYRAVLLKKGLELDPRKGRK